MKPTHLRLMRLAIIAAALTLVLGATHSIPAGPEQAGSGNPPLRTVADIPMPGPAVRFDYQSLDQDHGRLYISHMNADQLVVFDTATRQVVANLDGFKRVHGVWTVPTLGRVYASATGDHQVVVVDMKTLKTIARVGTINYPDGIAYAPGANRVFVSDNTATPMLSSMQRPISSLRAFPLAVGQAIRFSIRDQVASWLQSTRPMNWLPLTRRQPRLWAVIRRRGRKSPTAFPSMQPTDWRLWQGKGTIRWLSWISKP